MFDKFVNIGLYKMIYIFFWSLSFSLSSKNSFVSKHQVITQRKKISQNNIEVVVYLIMKQDSRIFCRCQIFKRFIKQSTRIYDLNVLANYVNKIDFIWTQGW